MSNPFDKVYPLLLKEERLQYTQLRMSGYPHTDDKGNTVFAMGLDGLSKIEEFEKRMSEKYYFTLTREEEHQTKMQSMNRRDRRAYIRKRKLKK